MMRRFFLSTTLSLLLLVPFAAQAQDIQLIGTANLLGTALDKSGLHGTYTSADGKTTIPAAQLGSFGSGLAYTGFGDTYIAVNDRGFDNGSVLYRDRFQVFHIAVDAKHRKVTPTLAQTQRLTREDGQAFVGKSSAFTTPDATRNLRLDPEGVRVAPDGTFYVSDEYGPVIYHFSSQGKRIGAVRLPAALAVAQPNADGDAETAASTSGRVANRGMEGLAITPDGKTLVGILQSPLIQDGGRSGVNIRIVKISLATGASRQYVYPLDSHKLGVSEIVAVNAHQFLVDERDSKSGTDAKVKDLYAIDLDGATDISAVPRLPLAGLPSGIVPVHKRLFMNMVDPAFGLAGPKFPEKIEGLAFGPDLPDGRHLLIVVNDNDLIPTIPNYFYAFAIAPRALPGFQKETIRVPFR